MPPPPVKSAQHSATSVPGRPCRNGGADLASICSARRWRLDDQAEMRAVNQASICVMSPVITAFERS